jgi:hypothetical protein
MGPSRKRARTKPPIVDESPAAIPSHPPSGVAEESTIKTSTSEADKHSDVVNKEEDAPTPLMAVKPEPNSSKQVRLSPVYLQSVRRKLTSKKGEIKE